MPKRKWSLIRAGLYGLVVQLVAIWLSDWYWGTHDWELITFYLESGAPEAIAVAASALIPAPIGFVVLAWIRNFAVKHSARSPS